MTGHRLPLEGLVVLDLTVARAGPTAVRHLADWGADIVRVEPPAIDATSRESADYRNLHRNKRIVEIDLKSTAGREAFLRLVETADILVENMRVGVKHRLNIAFEDLEPVNPRLVYGSISGFGQSGPYADRPALDPVAQGMSGLMSVTGMPGQGPMRTGVDITDLTAGNVLALGIMMALFERQRSGKGRWVHTSLLENALFMLDFQAARWLVDGDLPVQAGNDHPIHIPAGVFETQDGHVVLAASSQRLWPRLCEALDKPLWAGRFEWSTLVKRHAAREAINAAISAELRSRPSAHWIALFEKTGIPCGPINNIREAFADPQVIELGMAQPLDPPDPRDAMLVASPLNFGGVSKRRPKPARLPVARAENLPD